MSPRARLRSFILCNAKLCFVVQSVKSAKTKKNKQQQERELERLASCVPTSQNRDVGHPAPGFGPAALGS